MDHFPAYSSLLAFTPEALRNWGQAHENHSEQTLQFHTQLHEWKCTKQDLCTILGKAYEETQVLKEHVISNDVTQEHLYMLHIQVKHCKHLNSELGAQTVLHLSVSKGVIQRKRESQSSATSSSNDNCRPGPMAQAVHTGMKYVLFT